MLVLTRKPGETIVVGNNYRIEVVAVQRGVVKFAFYVDQPVTLMPGNVLIDAGDGDREGAARPIKVTRKVDDSVVIGEDENRQIEVLVVSVKGEAVRVGVKAPRDIQVHRQEVFEQILQENIAAAQPTDLDPSQLRQLLRAPQQPGADEGKPEDEPAGESPSGNADRRDTDDTGK